MPDTFNPVLADKPIVVGIGASAGGLEAVQQFLTGLPEEHHMVLVLVQHLDPDHVSLMPELIAAKVTSPVHSVTDNMVMEPGSIYLIPPGYEMEMRGNRLFLEEFKSPRGLRRPIDHFFRSMAQECGENAIAVVLSGTGSDGADGAREVKGAGGLVFVQDPMQAKYDSMPQSVLDQGGADVVSRAEEIVEVVQDYFNLRVSTHAEIENDDEFLNRIMRHVRFRTGHDFVDYKPGTMLRRIAVRMSVLNLITPAEYLKHVAENNEEAEVLFRDLLINVTSFFRDPKHFATLNREIISKIVENCPEHGEVRAWVAGCSTGEEAYTLAILLSEEISRTRRKCAVTVFATDIDEAALTKARAGQYSDAITGTIPLTHIDRYFRPLNKGYEVGPRLREMVRFSKHSFVKDPPFSKLDLVSCRNVLIYFKESLQETAMKVFHYALTEQGYLFIGPSENPKNILDYFDELAATARIFKRQPGIARPLNLGALSGMRIKTLQHKAEPPSRRLGHTEIERMLLQNHAPAHLHMDRNGDVIFSSANATRFLRVRGGKLSNALTSMIVPELETTMRRVTKMSDEAGAVSDREFQGTINGVDERLVITATRLADHSILIVIQDGLQMRDDRPGTGEDGGQTDGYVKELEDELDQARQAVRTTVEQLETSNEELKSSNEEMMSMNEELQSANEELSTINDELRAKLGELNQANTDLKNFTESARIATVFLDDEFRLRKFTPEAKEYFKFNQADIGRPMADLSATIDQRKLLELCRAVFDDQVEREHEFETLDGKESLAARIMLYSPDGKTEKGVVFTLQDVTELRDAVEHAEQMTALSEERLDEVEQIYRNSPMAMGLLDHESRYLRLNEQLAQINAEPLEAHLGATVRDIIPAVADQTEKMVKQLFETGDAVRGEIVHGNIASDPEPRVWERNWSPLLSGGEVVAAAVTVRDITEETRLAQDLKRVMNELEHRVKNMLANVTALIKHAEREAEADKEIYATLTGRIEGLSKTHALLTLGNWSSAPLRDIIAAETTSVYGADQVDIEGPDIMVNSQSTLALGMAMHELATNAAKYGAFSTPKGRVDIKWARITDVVGDRLVMTWQEHGGPKIDKPAKQGFGTELILSTIEGTLDGEVDKNWETDGLRVVIKLDYGSVSV